VKPSIAADIATIQSISAVPTILQVVAEMTGLRFVCVARVTEDSWTTCAVLDRIDFGLKPGDQLDLATTLCHEVRAKNSAIIIDQVSKDPLYRDHHTPKMYGFESYFSIPLHRPDGEYFGTLCGIDPAPASISDHRTVTTMTLFAELISRQLDAQQRLDESEAALLDARETAELREQFIAVLGHDLRTPLGSILSGADLLARKPLDTGTLNIVERIRRSSHRISNLINDVLDFARGRMGNGIPLQMVRVDNLQSDLLHVIAELQSAYPQQNIQADIAIDHSMVCDRERIAQLLSNLLTNALVHGAEDQPVQVSAQIIGDQFELAVVNHGPTIEPDQLERLFQPYWRGALHNQQGLGLGLYIAGEIAHSHGGNILVASANNMTTFTFVLPLTSDTNLSGDVPR
jgi:signal transduction histidine kinase